MRGHFFELQSLPTKGVDRRIVDWTSRYADLQLELKSVLERYAARQGPDHQNRLFMEGFMRGTQGDVLGAAIDEQQRQDVDVNAFRVLFDRRLRLLGEFVRLHNEFAPEDQVISLDK